MDTSSDEDVGAMERLQILLLSRHHGAAVTEAEAKTKKTRTAAKETKADMSESDDESYVDALEQKDPVLSRAWPQKGIVNSWRTWYAAMCRMCLAADKQDATGPTVERLRQAAINTETGIPSSCEKYLAFVDWLLQDSELRSQAGLKVMLSTFDENDLKIVAAFKEVQTLANSGAGGTKPQRLAKMKALVTGVRSLLRASPPIERNLSVWEARIAKADSEREYAVSASLWVDRTQFGERAATETDFKNITTTTVVQPEMQEALLELCGIEGIPHAIQSIDPSILQTKDTQRGYFVQKPLSNALVDAVIGHFVLLLFDEVVRPFEIFA